MRRIKERIRVEQNTIRYEDSDIPEVEYYIFAGSDNHICALTYEELKTVGRLIDEVISTVEKDKNHE